ncbi:FkbM family methyltransferase [Catenulispora subtropica]|uniref:Methyltransferase FkbM domain-containing protein n=1 Tax=Catenulispora subtropica TaxID=450798 RepID=A0ABP5EHA1_9ACTN
MVSRRRLPDGRPIAQVDPGEAALLYREIFQEHSYRRPGWPAGPVDVVFDIGANIGLASMYFKQEHPGAFVVAVEPGPDTFAALTENIAQHVPGGLALEVAVAGRSGTARFGYYPGAPAESGFYADPAGDTALAARLLVEAGLPGADAERLAGARHRVRYVECRTVTLSDLIAQTAVDRVDLVKIDVEKAEHEVLAGIAEADWPRIGAVVAEVHDLDGRLGRVVRELRDRGFAVAVDQEARLAGTDMHMVFADRGRRSGGRA